MTDRRSFLKRIGGIAAAVPMLGYFISSCKSKGSIVGFSGKILGASAAVGHMLRNNSFSEPEDIQELECVIVGGGVSGLSAARQLYKNNFTGFVVLELDEREGGNSSSGKNSVSSYPWGAHYLPVPDPSDKLLLQFLQEAGVVESIDANGIPFLNEYFLCHDPEERLYIHGQWQDGLIPSIGISEKDKQQVVRFLAEMREWKNRKGTDDKFAFSIPAKESSRDEEFLKLDSTDFLSYLKGEKYDSPYLFWYINYCCRDDYGTTIDKTSAWAGIHYFASRRGKAVNAESSDVLTWPEGNAFLVNHLRKDIDTYIRKNSLVYRIELKDSNVHVDYFDVRARKTKRIVANKCIMCTPQFVNQRLLKELGRGTEFYKKFNYAPWMVANITVKSLNERRGRPLSWDNVIYNAKSLGYINSNHQDVAAGKGKRVLTYYNALSSDDPVTERKKAFERTYEEWVKDIVDELSVAHPDFEKSIENIDLWIWGHGMISPVPGFIASEERTKAAEDIDGKIFFAHSDLSGISIFEEAFHQGIGAANAILNSNNA